ncbi:hypothetical protein EV144_101276 [Flavobacterium sp. 270]|uniref:hypothetical protein n=1 Tax=Flavobacterium sp. 270 TaxID=2512114 RepID=UPI0010650FBB|nr:hypothetical protein [Flavobacterium sp. 270]TDW51600.1 hypothetical protein EV144_101276 [Flavobacterium sp. 270]
MKIEELQNDIFKGVQKTAIFNENSRLNIHLIYDAIYSKYLKMRNEDFESEISYVKFIDFVAASKQINDIEICKLSGGSCEVEMVETRIGRHIFNCAY